MRRTTSAMTLILTVVLTVTVLVAAGTAGATAPRQADCSSCHGTGYQATVSATPSTGSPASGAAYSVAIAISQNPNGAYGTGYWIASSTAGGSTGTSTGVFAQHASSQTFTAGMQAPSAPGTYFYKVFGVDGPDSATRGQTGVAVYSITVPGTPIPPGPTPPGPTPAQDRTPPTTAQVGADDLWYPYTMTVSLSALDNIGGAGVALTEYSLDGGVGWVAGGQVTITADPATHASDGIHVISYRSTDLAGNVEATKTCTVRIDTSKPQPTATAVTRARRGGTAALKYRIADAAPNGGGADVMIKVTTSRGRTVKVLSFAGQAVNTDLSAGFRCKLAPGKYRYRVFAVDSAGNRQARAAVGKLIVKR